ncbi:hypothetical protein L1887_07384 [Cichorium endivia]|nr:hypothetical protein L1887_07384 [Cichorium endivia]
MLLALIIEMVPILKSIVYGDDVPLSIVTDSLDIVPSAMVPSVMLVLGGMIAEGDRMFQFVLLLQYTTPTAILFGAIASLRAYAVSEASTLFFWQHVFALFSFSMYSIIYFKLLLMM